MAIPLIVWAIVEIAIVSVTALEAASALRELFNNIDGFKKDLEAAKKEIEKLIKELKKEIDQKIEEKQEVVLLRAAAKKDSRRPETVKATGRGARDPLIEVAIEQKIPFRKVVSKVCDMADSMPMIQLRIKNDSELKKQGMKAKDIVKVKKTVLEAIIKRGIEAGADIENMDEFIVVQLKQLAADLLFEFIDYTLDWKSPLKCEVSFGPPDKYSDHPLADGSETQLRRVGKINPFYPNPPPNNRTGSISADLVIPDYRKKRCDKNNIFCIVEIKFQNDKIDNEQFKRYDELLKIAGNDKTASHTKRFNNKKVPFGGRLALFRYPEDRSPDKADEKGKPKADGQTTKQPAKQSGKKSTIKKDR